MQGSSSSEGVGALARRMQSPSPSQGFTLQEDSAQTGPALEEFSTQEANMLPAPAPVDFDPEGPPVTDTTPPPAILAASAKEALEAFKLSLVLGNSSSSSGSAESTPRERPEACPPDLPTIYEEDDDSNAESFTR
eukprot:TRINITY_DN57167_c0_g1_i1.p1 TRINITY_DN57167_c0_g1~~TRINITY_DN57167_c0_g1_i1.p1  ORF type:complete len:135 (-),score=36.93 TRINITY_DN57167_c0_g1_i1:28-432(-)